MGPLDGVRVIEIAGLGPGPLCGMLLADLGADVVRVDRFKTLYRTEPRQELLNRNKRSVAVNLKTKDGVETVLKMVESADIMFEGMRPGVTTRLGIGPESCLSRNPKLVYGQMTGWGQDGPYANMAGHDLNYIAITGAAHAIGSKERPMPPLNLVGDFGGGALYLALGMVAALVEARVSGRGQIIDCAMVDGASSLMTMMHALNQTNYWTDERESNLVDGGAHFYGCYETKDGKFVSVGAIEPEFYAILLEGMGLKEADLPGRQYDKDKWPALRDRFAEVFRTKTRDEWCDVLDGTDACFAPVLSLSEAPRHPHNVARGTFVTHEGMIQPGPAPRFSRTPGQVHRPPPNPGEHTREVLQDWGFGDSDVDSLIAAGAITEKAETGYR